MESTDSSTGSQQQQQHQQPQLPPGFRFHPTDEELVVHYLKRKAASVPLPVTIIAEVDLYKFDPWELPGKANFGEQEWYFFSPRDRKYPNGARPNRAATSGYWKATGTDKPILSSSSTSSGITSNDQKVKIGVKKALVFYGGKPPKGIKTNWIMHEYRLADNTNASTTTTSSSSSSSRPPQYATNNTHESNGGKKPSLRLDDWVLCRIYKKNNSSNCTVQRSLMEHDASMDNMLSVSAAAASTLPLINAPEAAAAICRVQQPINPKVPASQRLQQQPPLSHHQHQHQHATNYSSALLNNDDNFFQGFLSSAHDDHDHQEDGVHINSMSAAANINNMICRSSEPEPEQLCLVAPTFQAMAKRPLSSTILSPANYWHQCDHAGSNVISPAIPPSKRMLIQAQAYDGSSSSNNSTTSNLLNNANGNTNVNCNNSGTNSSSTNNNTDVDDCGGGPGEHTLATLLHHQIPRSSTSTANYHHGSFQMGSLQGDGTNSGSTVFGSQVPYQLLSSINWRTSS